MFTQGCIFYVNKFEFADGGEPKDKFLIILHINEEKGIIIKALPTSQRKLPFDQITHHGCINNELFSYYFFEEKREIGLTSDNKPFCFDLNTYIFFRENVSMIDINSLFKYIPDNFMFKAKLIDSEFERLMKCLLKSKHLKNKIKRELLK